MSKGNIIFITGVVVVMGLGYLFMQYQVQTAEELLSKNMKVVKVAEAPKPRMKRKKPKRIESIDPALLQVEDGFDSVPDEKDETFID